MATSGFFTYRDLYAGKPEYYHHQKSFQLSSSTTVESLWISDTTTDSLPETIDLVNFISFTTIQSSTSSNSLYKLVQLVPFAYFHWFLIGLAFLLTLLLTIIFTSYCLNHCRKNNKNRKEKKQTLPSFYRYRTTNGRVAAYSIFDSTVPLPYPSPTRPCPPKSVERLNNRLLRQGLDAIGSPQVPRTYVSQTEPSSTFTSTASDLLTEIKSRLNIRSSESSLANERLYETQRAKMALNDDSKNNSLLIDMN